MMVDPDFIARKRAARFGQIDSLEPELRELVHEYGWTVVKAFLDIGVRKPRHIKHLVNTVLDEFSPTRGACSNQGVSRAPGIDGKTAARFDAR